MRHGATKGNEEKRYIGSTDEVLSPKGETDLREKSKAGLYPSCQRLYTSPMRRCLSTADVLYPDMNTKVVFDLAEYHFGIFEGKNYNELNGTPEYQVFLDSGGTSPIPGAPDLEDYREKCFEAFMKIVDENLEKAAEKPENIDVAVICHGGTIMALLHKLRPLESMYSYQVKNGEGYTLEWQSDGVLGQIFKIGVE